jgi:hypothetical protein
MITGGGEYDAYNVQAAVDGPSGVIVAAALTNVAPDLGHLPELLARVQRCVTGQGSRPSSRRPARMLATSVRATWPRTATGLTW